MAIGGDLFVDGHIFGGPNDPCLLGSIPADADARHLGIQGLKLGKRQSEGQGIRRSGAAEGGDVEEYCGSLRPGTLA
jgi:hypothetical protein